MWHILSSFVRRYSIFLALFLLFLAVFIFSGFYLHVYINHWTLVTAFVAYILLWGIYIVASRGTREKFLFLALCALLTPILFLSSATAFDHTYDLSYDGQYYHEPAVIALADKWNPVYDRTFPLKTPQAASIAFDEGSPKIMWSIDASIYKLTHNIDSATVINLFIGLITLVFAWDGLRTLGLTPKWALILSVLTVFTTLFFQQLFSFMEDNLSYDFLIIGIASIIHIKKDRDKLTYFLCLLISLIFLAGTKYSDLYVFLSLVSVAAYIIFSQKLYKLKVFKFVALAGLICALVTLSNPYITNITRYHAIDYPDNEKVVADSLRSTGVPANIRTDSRLELFYYGIFFSSENSNIQNPANYARLKIPFTFTKLDVITEATDTSKLVGGYGVFFSGIFIVSVMTYIYLMTIKKSKHGKTTFTWLSMVLGLIFISCLLIPIPNYSRYNSQLDLLPIAIIVALLTIKQGSWRLGKILAVVLTICISLNIYFDAVPALLFMQTNFSAINYQLANLKDSKKTYIAHASIFYPNYLELESYGIKVKISASRVTCKNPEALQLSYSTVVCPL